MNKSLGLAALLSTLGLTGCHMKHLMADPYNVSAHDRVLNQTIFKKGSPAIAELSKVVGQSVMDGRCRRIQVDTGHVMDLVEARVQAPGSTALQTVSILVASSAGGAATSAVFLDDQGHRALENSLPNSTEVVLKAQTFWNGQKCALRTSL